MSVELELAGTMISRTPPHDRDPSPSPALEAPGRDEARTRRRLLDVAGQTFGERGFRATTIREICRRARVNVASVHYHFGSKKDLYLAALREALEAAKKGPPPRPDPPLERPDAPRFLRFFVRFLVERVLGARPGWHQELLQRELVEPSFALDVVVREYIRPHFRSLCDALALLLPRASAREVELHALSIIGQVVYYRAAAPVAQRLLGVDGYDAATCERLAAHVTRFSSRALGVRA